MLRTGGRVISQTQQRTDDREPVEPIVDLRQLATYVPQRSSPTTRPLPRRRSALAYLIVRGEGMAERAAEDYSRREQAFQE
jgi:hypothetical protein